MTHPWHEITPAGESGDLPLHFQAVIEIPRGSNLKFELDKGTGLLKLDRVLSSAVYYPANYGFIPQTLAEDDDPLDVLVYCTEPIPPLCICQARAVGLAARKRRTLCRRMQTRAASVCASSPGSTGTRRCSRIAPES